MNKTIIYIKSYPITSLIFLINTFYFVYTILTGGFTDANLNALGAFQKQEVLNGEWKRLIISMFLHGGTLHFLMNMIVLIQFGKGIEELLGKIKYVLLYFVSGICGNLATFYLSNDPSISIGASGALFGVLGVYVYLALFKNYILARGAGKEILQMVALNLVLTLMIPYINKFAHFGGLIAGFILAFFFTTHLKKRNDRYEQTED